MLFLVQQVISIRILIVFLIIILNLLRMNEKNQIHIGLNF